MGDLLSIGIQNLRERIGVCLVEQNYQVGEEDLLTTISTFIEKKSSYKGQKKIPTPVVKDPVVSAKEKTFIACGCDRFSEKYKGSLEAESIVRWQPPIEECETALSVLFKNSVVLVSVRTENYWGLKIFVGSS
ncbi:hypothetical protein Tco_0779275 [Tanacetum coccineum]